MSRKNEYYKKEMIHKKEVIAKEELPAEEFKEEYAAEFTPTLSTLVIDTEDEAVKSSVDWWNFGVAFIGLVISAFSVFIMPIYLGLLGTTLGYLAYMKGERDVTPWTISLGISGILIGLFLFLT